MSPNELSCCPMRRTISWSRCERCGRVATVLLCERLAVRWRRCAWALSPFVCCPSAAACISASLPSDADELLEPEEACAETLWSSVWQPFTGFFGRCARELIEGTSPAADAGVWAMRSSGESRARLGSGELWHERGSEETAGSWCDWEGVCGESDLCGRRWRHGERTQRTAGSECGRWSPMSDEIRRWESGAIGSASASSGWGERETNDRIERFAGEASL